MDFGALPPEINSGRMYSGPGSGPMLAAAAAWGGLASELSSTASSYDSVLSGLSGDAWSGPSAASMTAAVTPYVAWLSSTATAAEQAAEAGRAAAAAYDSAFAATVPPPVIAANRSLLMALIATNVLGQNTAAIAATEAHYGEMWAQDAAAMYGYAAASASATQMTPFTAPPATTEPAGAAGQAAAVLNTAAGAGGQAQNTLAQLISMVPPTLQALASSGPPAAQAESPILAILDFLAGPTSPISLFGIGGIPYLLAIQCVMLPMNGANVMASLAKASAAGVIGAESMPGGLGGVQLVSSAASSGTGSVVSAGAGSAGSVGRLSVPQGWTTTVSEVKSAAAAAPGAGPFALPAVTADSHTALLSNLALGGLAGRAAGAGGGAASRAVGGVTGSLAGSKPAGQATIIVIPPSAED